MSASHTFLAKSRKRSKQKSFSSSTSSPVLTMSILVRCGDGRVGVRGVRTWSAFSRFVACFRQKRRTWQVGTTSKSETSSPGNIACASALCFLGHACTEYSMPHTEVVTGTSIVRGFERAREDLTSVSKCKIMFSRDERKQNVPSKPRHSRFDRTS